MFVRIADLHVRASLGVVQSLAVGVLMNPCFINCWIWGIFSSKLKMGPWPLRHVIPFGEILLSNFSLLNELSSYSSKSGEVNNHKEEKNFIFVEYLVNYEKSIYARCSKFHMLWISPPARGNPSQYRRVKTFDGCQASHESIPLGEVLYQCRESFSK